MTVKLYVMGLSPPGRAVMMLSKLIDVPAELIEVDLTKNEHTSDAYKKINPLHTVPSMNDNGLILHDSHAILMYLSDAYGKNDNLYPKDLIKRAKVNQKLLFNNSVLFQRFKNISYYAYFLGETKPNQRKLFEIRETYDYLEQFLSQSKFLALDHITIADLAAAPSVSASNVLIPLDGNKYPNTLAWLRYIKSQPFYKHTEEDDIAYANMLKNLIVIE